MGRERLPKLFRNTIHYFEVNLLMRLKSCVLVGLKPCKTHYKILNPQKKCRILLTQRNCFDNLAKNETYSVWSATLRDVMNHLLSVSSSVLPAGVLLFASVTKLAGGGGSTAKNADVAC
jgi:hypothetical protein